MRRRVHDPHGALHIDVGILEQAQAELQLENSAHGAIHQRHGDTALFHALDQRPHVSRLVGDIQIDSGFQTQLSGFLLGGHDVLVNHGGEAAAFALDDALETDLLPQNVVHPLHRGVRRHVFHFRITGHHAQAPGFGDGADPGRHEILAQATLRHLDRTALKAARRFALRGKIGQHRDDLVGRGNVGTLRGAHDGLAEAHVEVRVFGVGFLVASHARIAIHFHHQRGKHVDPDRARLLGRRRVDCLHQIQVERAAHGQALRENRGARKHGAMRPFLVLHDRYFQARLRECNPLQLVEILRLLARAFVQNLIGEREEAAGRTDFGGVGSGREFPTRLQLRGDVFAQFIHIHTR